MKSRCAFNVGAALSFDRAFLLTCRACAKLAVARRGRLSRQGHCVMRNSGRLLHLVFITLTAALVLGGCGRDSAGPNQSANNAEKPRPANGQSRAPDSGPPAETVSSPPLKLVQKEISLKWVDKGVLRTSLTAASVGAQLVNGRGEIVGEMQGVSAKLYDGGKLSATMTAPKAVVDTPSRTITATGGVVVDSVTRNTVIKCDWAKWHERKSMIVGNGGVSINSETLKAEAAAFVYDIRSQKLSLHNSAKGLDYAD